MPALKDVSHLPVANLAWFLSFATWVVEAVFVTASQYWLGVRDVQVSLGPVLFVPLDLATATSPLRTQAGADRFGYDIASIGPPIGAVFGLGLLWRLIALYILAAQASGKALPAAVSSCVSAIARGCKRRVGQPHGPS